MKRQLLIYATADNKYLEFALIYPIFALLSNPTAVVEIGIVGRRAWWRLYRQYGHLLEFYNMRYPDRILFRPIRKFLPVFPNSVRFLVAPKTRAKYVYIGDIDIMLTQPILAAHLENMRINNLDFSNIKRKGEDALSGLHFIEYDKMYPARPPFFANLRKMDDESLLFQLMRARGYNIPDENVTFRPLHGVHASWFSRAPLPTRTTGDDLVAYPCWASTTDNNIDTTYSGEYLLMRHSAGIRDFMQNIRENDVELRKIIQCIDMFCNYMCLHYSRATKCQGPVI